MVRSCLFGLALLISASAIAQVGGANADTEQARQAEAFRKAYNAMPDTPGTGPYPARMTTDSALPGYTLYRPADLDRMGGKKLGLLIWGNGGCANDGASSRLHLAEIASHGYLVIAPGNILTGPSAPAGAPASQFMTTTLDDMKKSLNWALAENRRKGSSYYRRIDPDAVAVSGYSCGGMLAIQLASDPRLKAIVLQNSGLFPNRPNRPQLVIDKAMLKGLHTPVLYVVGDQTDVAWQLTNEDFALIEHVPVMMASLKGVGHQGTFARPNGGPAARVAVDWLEWQLRKDKHAARTFTGADCGLCSDSAWTVRRKGIR